jgi:hypothetical protein
MNLKLAIAGLAAGFALSALPAAANTIQIGTTAATITCSVTCTAFIGAGGVDTPPSVEDTPTGPGTQSSTKAQLYDGTPASQTAERARLADLLGLADATTLGNRTELGAIAAFNSGAQYIVLKIGQNDVFIVNTSGGSQSFTYNQNGAQALGLSGVNTYLTAAVPVPAAVWLMGAGLAGLGFAGRRKKSA